MILEAMITAAPYLTPFAAGVLSASIYGLRRTVRNLDPEPVRVEPELSPPQIETPPQAQIRAPETEAERRAEIRRRITPKLIVSQARAAEILIEFMNANEQFGYFTASELDDHWDWCVAERDLEPMNGGLVREALSKHKVGQCRLNSPKFAKVRQRCPGIVRPVIYNIPKVRVKSGEGADSPADGRESPGGSGVQSALPAGRLPASVQSHSQGRAAA